MIGRDGWHAWAGLGPISVAVYWNRALGWRPVFSIVWDLRVAIILLKTFNAGQRSHVRLEVFR